MRTIHTHVMVTVFGVVACGGTTIGTSRQFDDASAGSGGTAPSPGSGGSMGSTGGSVLDASSGTDAGLCGTSPSVKNVVEAPGPQSPAPTGTGGTSDVGNGDAGRLPGLPTHPCTTYVTPACPGSPRSIFGCPIVRGPSGSSTVRPGDQITVTVPITDEGLSAYSCMGILQSALIGGSSLFYAVKPAYVEVTGQVPPSTKPGTVLHFGASAEGTGRGTACSNDLTKIDFDVTVE